MLLESFDERLIIFIQLILLRFLCELRSLLLKKHLTALRSGLQFKDPLHFRSELLLPFFFGLQAACFLSPPLLLDLL